MIDLHTHSTASDGALSPAALIGKAAELNTENSALAGQLTAYFLEGTKRR